MSYQLQFEEETVHVYEYENPTVHTHHITGKKGTALGLTLEGALDRYKNNKLEFVFGSWKKKVV